MMFPENLMMPNGLTPVRCFVEITMMLIAVIAPFLFYIWYTCPTDPQPESRDGGKTVAAVDVKPDVANGL